jgi:hypothetical protein
MLLIAPAWPARPTPAGFGAPLRQPADARTQHSKCGAVGHTPSHDLFRLASASLQAHTCFVELLLPDYPNIDSLAGEPRHLATLLRQALVLLERCSVGCLWLLVAMRSWFGRSGRVPAQLDPFPSHRLMACPACYLSHLAPAPAHPPFPPPCRWLGGGNGCLRRLPADMMPRNCQMSVTPLQPACTRAGLFLVLAP